MLEFLMVCMVLGIVLGGMGIILVSIVLADPIDIDEDKIVKWRAYRVALIVVVVLCFFGAIVNYSHYLTVKKECYLDKSREACVSLVVDYDENPQEVNPDIKVRLEL